MTPIERAATIAALKAAYGGEALFRPSNAERWGNCLGSVRLGANAPKERRPSQWAIEGSATHRVIEAALKGEMQPEEWIDRMVRIDTEGMDGAFCDQEMVDCAEEFVDLGMRYMTLGAESFSERKLTLAHLDPSDPLWAENRGTGDWTIVDRTEGILTLLDYKHGKGVLVSPDTVQVKDYLLMALLEFFPDGGCKKARMVVAQPRVPEWELRKAKPEIEVDVTYLLTDFLGQLTDTMERALEPNAPLVTGPWCRWCRAKAICPELQRGAMSISRDPFAESTSLRTAADMLTPIPSAMWIGTIEEPRPKGPLPSDTVVLPSPTAMDPGELSAVLSRRHLWDIWIEGVEHRAVALLESGTTIPGWRLGRRTTRRRWKADMTDEQRVAALRERGLSVGEMYADPKLKSPNQVEKLLDADKRSVVLPEGKDTLVERPVGDLILVPADSAKPSAPSVLGPIDPGLR